MKLIRDNDIALLGKTIGSVAYNGQAPKPCVTRRYRFTSSGSCRWITAGATAVKKDDYVLVIYSGHGFYRYVHEPSSKVETATLDALALVLSNFKSRLFGSNTNYALLAATMKLYAHIPFDTGTTEIVAGDTLVGSTSTASHTVHSVTVLSGTWAGGDAAGYLILDERAGYLSTPYTDGEDLQIDSVTVAKRTSAAAYGAFIMGEAINVDSIATSDDGLTITHADVEATAPVALVATGLRGLQVAVSAGVDSSVLAFSKLSANLETGAVSATEVDLTSLANCISDDTLHIIGIVR